MVESHTGESVPTSEDRQAGRIVTFWKYRRRAECSVCRALVPKHGIKAHARWHVSSGEGQIESVGLYRAFKDVTVHPDHTLVTGWSTLGVWGR